MTTGLQQSFRIDPSELPGESVIFGSTPAMREVRSKIDSILSSDLPVLIQGESGTGKEVIARFLHTRSDRREAPFAKLNCGAISADLLESELFGCEKGALAGATEDRPGYVEIAEGGTLFLNEIGEMSLEMQGKLLHLLRDGSYTRKGGSEKRTGHVRVFCATSVDLQEVVESGAFREDLCFRISVESLQLSPLRDRINDIPQLCEHFLEKLSRQFRRSIPRLHPTTLDLLKQWGWPGNLRELENWIARAIILGDDEAVGAELKRQLSPRNGMAGRQFRWNSVRDMTNQATSAFTNTAILRALKANHGNRRRTAEELKMSYRALLYKLRNVGLPQRRRSHRNHPPAQT